MKKQITALSLCVILTACGGGSGGTGATGPAGAPGKSAYDIWLEQGNTGTEQDFLDSLVGQPGTSGTNGVNGKSAYEIWLSQGYTGTEQDFLNWLSSQNYTKHWPVNTKDHLNMLRGSYTETQKEWAAHDGYKEYEYIGFTISDHSQYSEAVKLIYKEKELELGNYGLETTYFGENFSSGWDDNPLAEGYIQNREGAGANLYTPEPGTVFVGGTLAYLMPKNPSTSRPSAKDAELIKGDVKFVYDPTNPVLNLDFENYYSFVFSDFAKNTTSKKTVISGTNSTGNDAYNLSTGTQPYSGYINLESGQVKKGDIEEAFGTYDIEFGTLGINGAYGATKQ